MTLLEAEQIIQKENLKNYNWYNEMQIRPEEVGIKKNNGKWIVYTADERLSIKGEVQYDTEGEALKDFIERLRADKILREI